MNLCTSRCADAGIRLGTSVVGLLPLAASATGQGIRSRILALQLMTTACDRATYGHMGNVAHGFDGSSLTPVLPGHTSVSEALSTLRLRCGEPVRFRLLVGMLNSGGGSGELQMFGMKFINTFLNNAENSQQRLYLQAELSQAGLDPETLDKVKKLFLWYINCIITIFVCTFNTRRSTSHHRGSRNFVWKSRSFQTTR